MPGGRNKPSGTIELTNTNPPVRDALIWFRVTSDDPNLFVHLKGFDEGTLVYEGWARWFGQDVSFHLSTPGMDAGTPPFQFKALLEDWTDYGLGRKPTQINELDFTVN